MSTPASTEKRRRPRRGVPRRLGSGLVNLLVVAVMLCCAGWLAPHFLGYSRYVITSGSMTGTYDQGSVVFEKPVPAARLRVGDVITYMPPPDAGVPHLVTHRIISMKPAEGGGVVFTTQGDANPDPDPWHFELVQATQPVVHFGVPHVGWIFIALAHREVRMLAIGVPAGLVGLSALVQLLGGIRESHRDRRNRRNGRNGRNEVVSTRGRHVTAGGPVVAKP